MVMRGVIYPTLYIGKKYNAEKMIRYRLSKNFCILDPAAFSGADTPAQYQQGYYVLSDENRDKSFLINDTIKYFIDKFSLPKTQAEVLQEVALDVKTDIQVIRRKCSSFLTFLRQRKIVVPEDWVEAEIPRQALFQPGDFIGDLCVSELIADKKYVDIYLVRDPADDQPYVIKLLNCRKFKHKRKYLEEELALRHEYEMLQKVKHIPFICQAYGLEAEAKPGAYLKLEYIRGRSLSRHLRQAENLDQAACYAIIHNMLQTFSMLHESKLIHGDIHPANIMVKEDNSIKVIDLGLSLPVDVDRLEVVNFGGVIYYMPPERINISSFNKFSKKPDYYSDVYQIGLIMYFILYRREPFSGFIWEELSANIKGNKITFPERSCQDFPVPGQLIKIIKKSTIKTRGRRYPSATAVLKDFQRKILKTQVATS
jgi:tRNA A-37 threonylcarbamoyl transferase component Bud32